jgi:hypothetical protein
MKLAASRSVRAGAPFGSGTGWSKGRSQDTIQTPLNSATDPGLMKTAADSFREAAGAFLTAGRGRLVRSRPANPSGTAGRSEGGLNFRMAANHAKSSGATDLRRLCLGKLRSRRSAHAAAGKPGRSGWKVTVDFISPSLSAPTFSF